MMVVALLECLVTSRLGRGAQTKHGLYLQSNMHIFLVLQGDIARGEKKPCLPNFSILASYLQYFQSICSTTQT